MKRDVFVLLFALAAGLAAQENKSIVNPSASSPNVLARELLRELVETNTTPAEGFVPNRDIVVALTADEESGPANGISWLLAQRRDLMDVAYCLNLDAGGGMLGGSEYLRHSVHSVCRA